MKKLMVAVFCVSTLSACQTTPTDSQGADANVNLSTQYSSKPGGNTAADINTELGKGYILNGRYDRALVKLNKAIRQNPNHALAHNYLGVLYSRLDRPQQAEQEFKLSNKLMPNNSVILDSYATFLCEQKRFAEASEKFTRVVNNPLYIERAGAYQRAGACAADNNDYSAAEELYRKSLEINPSQPRSQLGLARIYYKQASYEYAWSYFKRFDDGSIQDSDSLWLGINILKQVKKPNYDLLASYKLQLKSKFPNSDEARWFFEGKQEY